IIAARPVTRTSQLADIVTKTLGPAAQRYGVHPATRTFQALRIYVNDELGELARGLESAARLLKPHGRLPGVCFHSLEDRMVKQFFAARGAAVARGSRHAPERARTTKAQFEVLTSRPRLPGAAEIERNPRARSARLRGAERLAA